MERDKAKKGKHSERNREEESDSEGAMVRRGKGRRSRKKRILARYEEIRKKLKEKSQMNTKHER